MDLSREPGSAVVTCKSSKSRVAGSNLDGCAIFCNYQFIYQGWQKPSWLRKKSCFPQKPEKSLIQMKNWKISTWFGKSRGIEKNPRLCPKVALTRNMPRERIAQLKKKDFGIKGFLGRIKQKNGWIMSLFSHKNNRKLNQINALI